MNTLLTWNPPLRQDRQELSTFTCTVKAENRRRAGRWEAFHPAPWERLVQGRIRTCHPPCQPPDFALLGRDKNGIGGFVFWEELDGPALVEIHVAAVALRLRGKGGGWADEMMRTVFDQLTGRALENQVEAVGVATWIHEKNRGSQRLCRRYGMVHTGKCMNGDPTLQRWTTQILVGGADIEMS